MPRYQVRVLTKQGPSTILVEGPTSDYAKKVAARQGRVSSISVQRNMDFTPGLSAADRYIFLMRMSSMLTAKVSTGEALRLMENSFGGKIKKVSKAMRAKVELGLDVPTAMEQDPKNFPVTTNALMRAGIAGGDTGKAMRDVAEFEYQIASSTKGSMKEVYNAVGSFFMASLMILATTQYFGPQVMDNPIFRDAKGVDVAWARTLGNVATVSCIVMASILFFFAWLGTIGRRLFPNLADALIMKIPFYKDLILSKNNHITLYKLGLLVQSGVRIEESLQITEQSSPKGALRTDLKRALNAMRSGKPWAAAMQTLHATDKAALGTSSDRDDVSRTLVMLAKQYSDLYVQRIQTFAPTIGMVAALFMTAAGGILFAQTILPMLQLAQNVN